MAEAELRRETERMFQGLGITDLPSDTLDFFQRNLENGGGSSSEWKRSLMGPSTRPRRTSSDGNALVHLKKKYATGLNPDYHSKRNAAIAAVTQKSATTVESNVSAESESSKDGQKLRTRRLSPASGLKGRFGYSGPVGSPGSVAEGSGKPEANSSSKASSSSEPPAKEVSMLKRRSLKAKAVLSSRDDVEVEKKGEPPSTSRKLVHTSSAGSVLKQPQSRGQSSSSSNDSSSISRRLFGSMKEPCATIVNGVHSSMPASSIQAPTASVPSHRSTMTTTSNTGITSSTAQGISSIDSIKLSSVNMRSLTKATPERNVPTERKISTEQKVSTERKLSFERRYSSEKRMSDTEKPSFIPVPAQASGSSKSSGSTTTAEGNGEGNNTHVVFSKKSSFKVLNVSSSSHRITHTVQDGGAPKRQNSISRGARPVSVLSRQVPEGNSTLKLEKRAPSSSLSRSGRDSSSSASSLVTHSNVSVEEGEPRRQAAKTAGQNRKEGVYDRLSPPVENPATKLAEPVYETVGEKRSEVEPAAKEDVRGTKSSGVPKAGGSLKLGRFGGVFGGSKDASKTVNLVAGRGTQSVKLAGSGRVQSTSNPGERGSRCETKLPENGGEDRTIGRYSTESGAVYSVIDKKTALSQRARAGGEGREGQHMQSGSGSLAKMSQQHKALCASVSDTSSEVWLAKNQEISTSESDVERCGSSSAISHSDGEGREERPLIGGLGEVSDPDKRMAMLEMNWSEQSLDKNMREVATSTVAALSTLVEVLTTPAPDSVDKKFQFDSER